MSAADPSEKEDVLAGKTKTVFNREGAPQGKMPDIPESIRKSSPKLTLEMPGPLGDAARRQDLEKAAERDHTRATGVRAKILADKQKSSLLASKENSRGSLKTAFTHAKSVGRAKGPFNSKAKDRGR